METITNTHKIQFKLKNGTLVSYAKAFEMREEYYKQLNLKRGGSSEGLWVIIHPDDLEDYRNNVTDDPSRVRLCVMNNVSLNGIPWLAITPYLMRGQDRPICVMDDLIDLEGAPSFVGFHTGEMVSTDEHVAWEKENEREEKEQAKKR